MPRAPRAVRLRQSYSPDLKARVVYQHEILGKRTTQISINLRMPVRVVQRVLETWKKLGMVCRPCKGLGRGLLLSGAHCRIIIALIEQMTDIYLDEIQLQLLLVYEIEVSLATLSRTLKRLGYSCKKLSRVAAERSAEKRLEFQVEIGTYPPEYLVFADEAAVNILTTYRTNGWSKRGLRARKRCNFVRGTRYSLLPAITTNGIIYSHVKVGGYNGEEFCLWLEGLMKQMNPYPAPRSVLVIDNCSIHHVAEVDDICAARGIKLVYLPPYSPDLNPIEESFSFVKKWIQRNGAEFRDIIEYGSPTDPYHFLYHALEQITAEASQGWFRHSGYM